MAKLNNVTIETEGFCTDQTIETLKLGDKSLIISDCEGYESTLFTPALCTYLKGHDLLIECHDFIDILTRIKYCDFGCAAKLSATEVQIRALSRLKFNPMPLHH
ncbi:MAG: hypothetical protein ACI8Z5_000574 [Lentimonas sp.]|jgi:hypothetical protein